jgi:hypothetical protein
MSRIKVTRCLSIELASGVELAPGILAACTVAIVVYMNKSCTRLGEVVEGD